VTRSPAGQGERSWCTGSQLQRRLACKRPRSNRDQTGGVARRRTGQSGDRSRPPGPARQSCTGSPLTCGRHERAPRSRGCGRGRRAVDRPSVARSTSVGFRCHCARHRGTALLREAGRTHDLSTQSHNTQARQADSAFSALGRIAQARRRQPLRIIRYRLVHRMRCFRSTILEMSGGPCGALGFAAIP